MLTRGPPFRLPPQATVRLNTNAVRRCAPTIISSGSHARSESHLQRAHNTPHVPATCAMRRTVPKRSRARLNGMCRCTHRPIERGTRYEYACTSVPIFAMVSVPFPTAAVNASAACPYTHHPSPPSQGEGIINTPRASVPMSCGLCPRTEHTVWTTMIHLGIGDRENSLATFDRIHVHRRQLGLTRPASPPQNVSVDAPRAPLSTPTPTPTPTPPSNPRCHPTLGVESVHTRERK